MSPEELDATADRLKAEVEAKAAAFAADPAKGHAAGYSPEHLYQQSPEIGSNEQVKVRSDLSAWMRGVARRDLSGWEWRVNDAPGGTAFVTIGRLRQ
jgi:hypothetical protein